MDIGAHADELIDLGDAPSLQIILRRIEAGGVHVRVRWLRIEQI